MLAFFQCVDAALGWLATRTPIMTGGAAMFAAWIAWKGYNKWHPETIGKRRIELAEDVLAGFYNARDLISAARFPGSFGQEGVERPGRGKGDETPDQERARDMYYWPIERLTQKSEVFNELHSKKYRAMALIGKHCEKPFNDLKKSYSRIISAASMLIKFEVPGGPELKQRERYEAIIGHGFIFDEEGELVDEFARNIDQIVADVEGIFGSLIGRELAQSSQVGDTHNGASS